MGIEREVLAWLADGSDRAAARSMAFGALGIPCKPYIIENSSDLDHCLKLLHRIPEIRSHFPKIAAVSHKWAKFITAWGELERQFLEELGWDFSISRSGPHTYDLIRKINPDGGSW